jgi:hypothetical protein
MSRGPAKSSGQKSASVAIVTGPGLLRGLIVEADGTNAATAIVYDGTSAAGTELMKIIVDATSTHEAEIFEHGISADTGIYLALSGTGAKAIVLYDKC